MDAISLIRGSLKSAHESFDGTVADVTVEQAHWQPPGLAHPVGSLYAHMVVGEDVLINSVVKGGAPLYATTWAGKTGLADAGMLFNRTLEQARAMHVDLAALHEYAQAVYAASDEHLASLDDAALDRIMDMTQYGFGQMTVGAFLANFVVGHVHDIMGEISALKGVQGARGYPF